ncbi:hypothetical protein [Methylophaga sp.]|uniref:hypothetical protein n=1 Tax=Methylophaga sp. TaxID=2024840 RepID=UPI003A9135F0
MTKPTKEQIGGATGEQLQKQQKQLQSKIAALSIAVADNDIDEVKRLLPLSGEQVVREIQAEAIVAMADHFERIMHLDGWVTSVPLEDIDKYANQLRNPEQEKV